MVLIPGTMAVIVEKRHGKEVKSAFLDVSIGIFHVKYHHLNNLHEGKYEGNFKIAKINPRCRECNGKHLLEMEFVVDDIFFLGVSFNKHCES